eukprot:6089547-Pyramimonas_sp.AAC.1
MVSRQRQQVTLATVGHAQIKSSPPPSKKPATGGRPDLGHESGKAAGRLALPRKGRLLASHESFLLDLRLALKL